MIDGRLSYFSLGVRKMQLVNDVAPTTFLVPLVIVDCGFESVSPSFGNT